MPTGRNRLLRDRAKAGAMALVCGFTGASAALGVDCSDNASNLLRKKNCDLTDGVDGWSKELGHFDILHIPDDGTPVADGAGEQFSFDIDLSSSFWWITQQTSRCAAIVPGGAYSWGGSRRFVDNAVAATCRVLLKVYTGDNCTGTGPSLNGSVTCPLGTTWSSCSASIAAGILTAYSSARLILSCDLAGPAVSSFIVRFDEAFITGPDPTILESDFEDGTFGEWTVVSS